MKKLTALAAFVLLTSCGQDASSAGDNASSAPTEAATLEDQGRRLFNECAVCHTVKEGDANRVGPNLFNIVGGEAGQTEGFAYSKAMTDSGLVWTEDNLNAFIENPQSFLRGNRMAYVGQRDADKRAALIAYLKTLKPAAEKAAAD